MLVFRITPEEATAVDVAIPMIITDGHIQMYKETFVYRGKPSRQEGHTLIGKPEVSVVKVAGRLKYFVNVWYGLTSDRHIIAIVK